MRIVGACVGVVLQLGGGAAVMAAAGTRTAGLVGPAMTHQSGAATRFFDCLRRPACKPGLLGTFSAPSDTHGAQTRVVLQYYL